MKKLKGNAVVGQSGGPTAVINQSLVGVIEECREHDCVENLLGAVHAVSGIVKGDFVNLDAIPKRQLEYIAGSPSSALGSSRDKPDEAYCAKIFDVFKKNNVRYFFYIGGNDSASTAHIINTMAQKADYELRVFHIPKTIDNDLRETDHCPGYGSAATFVAHAMVGDDLDNRALPGVKIDIIMGRNAGWLTASSALARREEGDGPHLIYVPERGFTMENFVYDVQQAQKKYGRCLVAASEGITDTNGVPWAQRIQENAEVDSHGNVQLSGSGALADFLVSQLKKKDPKARVRADTFGYLQRSFPGVVSPVDAYEGRYCGRMAVYYATSEEHSAGSVGMERFGKGDRYRIETFVTTLASVAVHTKHMPDNFITPEGNNVTPEFIEYLSPLVGDMPEVGRIYHPAL